jgi:hypothetical protein
MVIGRTPSTCVARRRYRHRVTARVVSAMLACRPRITPHGLQFRPSGAATQIAIQHSSIRKFFPFPDPREANGIRISTKISASALSRMLCGGASDVNRSAGYFLYPCFRRTYSKLTSISRIKSGRFFTIKAVISPIAMGIN